MNNILKVSNGNPGAMSVVTKLHILNRLDLVDKLVDNNIVGSKVWIIYKDYCNENINLTIKYIEDNV